MKIAALLSAFLTTAAFACPNMTGTYHCESQDESYEQTITQKTVNGVTVYTAKSEGETTKIAADGQWRELNEEGLKEAAYRASCPSTDSVKLEVKGVYVYQGQEFGFESESLMTKLAGGDYMTNSTSRGADGTWSETESETCTRL